MKYQKQENAYLRVEDGQVLILKELIHDYLISEDPTLEDQAFVQAEIDKAGLSYQLENLTLDIFGGKI